jgi:hypothetical protein
MDDHVARPGRRDPVFAERLHRLPVFDEVEDRPSEEGLANGECVMRRLSEPDRFGFAFAPFREAAELGETEDEPLAIVNGNRCGESEAPVGTVCGRREILNRELHRPLVFTTEVMRLRDIGHSETAELWIFQLPSDRQRAGARG